MPDKKEIQEQITRQGLLPLFYNSDAATCIDLLKALYAAGIRSVEYASRGEAALANFRAMKKFCASEMKDVHLGAGTIRNAVMARSFIQAGCDYIISPGLVAEVAEVADANDMLWIPGCMTPTEIIAAERMGATMIKLFPGNVLGPGYMSAVKELFPGLLFMPTGGVDASKESIGAWFKAGVCAVGMGSKLVSKEVMEKKQYDLLASETEKVMTIINDCIK